MHNLEERKKEKTNCKIKFKISPKHNSNVFKVIKISKNYSSETLLMRFSNVSHKTSNNETAVKLKPKMLILQKKS